ncbi:DUF4352 domain-containing protein [Paractinoplanes rishiriensis]|uniref:DUF4352 domain-containing protein n=1 Tax=Paractinoplanes rishiriensis TaxID=1050105 RepID=A0A919K387_9ACTN|nr:DUF4352 domain-containing protein [Actinoplanes rishiriensis]GIE98447.1 hypothetical protein Ari01nite_59120 [Actinoplanes rishiriensis]
MTYPPQYDQNHQPASGPPHNGPPEHQQYGQPQGQPPPGGQQGYPPANAAPAAPQGHGEAQGYAQYGGSPGYQPPTPEKKKRKKWPFIVGGIALIMILGCVGIFALFGWGASEVAKDMGANADGKNAVAGEMNKPATDGKFQFTVTDLKCGVAQVGSKDFGEQAQGEFCLVGVAIKNVGTSAEAFSDVSQKAYDEKNTEYSVDSGAAAGANNGANMFLETINPGNTVKGKLVFDVPPGTKLTSIVLHESMFTAGVRVSLS